MIFFIFFIVYLQGIYSFFFMYYIEITAICGNFNFDAISVFFGEICFTLNHGGLSSLTSCAVIKDLSVGA